MNGTSDNFDRRHFLKAEITEILNTAGLTSTFAQTTFGRKKSGPDDGSTDQPVIRI